MLYQRLLCALCVFWAVGNVRGDFVLSVTDNSATYTAGSVPVFAAGSTGKVTVWVYDTAPAGRTITGYDLAFDLGAAGKGFPNAFSSFAAIERNAALNIGPGFRPSDTAAANYDFLISTSGNPTVAVPGISTPIKLFAFQFNIAPDATAGLYDFKFRADAVETAGIGGGTVSMNNLAGADNTITRQALGGQFQVTAVPEPSSMALLGLVAVGAGGFRIFRKRKVIPHSTLS